MTEQNQNCIWAGIGIDIPEGSEIYQKIIEMNNLLIDKYGARKDYTGSECPHLNLYDLSVPNGNAKLIVEKIRQISEEQRSFTAKIKRVNYFHFGLFFMEIEKNDMLVELHERIVGEVVKLKDTCIDEDYLAPHRKYNARQKELLMEYGNPHVLDQFQPHITIGHVKNQENKLNEILDGLNKFIPMIELRIDNVHIVTGDGKNKKTLGKFNLVRVS